MKILLCLLLIYLVGSANAVYSNKTVEGYRSSFLVECPGSMKPFTIADELKKYIELYISGAKYPIGRWVRYNYHTRGLIAKEPSMDWSKKTLIYIPGWMDNIMLPVASTMTQYYKRIGYNVAILNVFNFQIEEFPRAVRASPTIGRHVAEMLANLTASQPKFSPKRLQLIGLSLGGQTESFIAKEYTKLTGLKISRLTALDPAGPCFRNRGPEGRIDASDADWVEMVQTNIDGMGMAAPVAHINYYVNGGETQPGDLYWMFCGSFCSHIRSYTVWMAAMDHPEGFIAIKCDSVQDARNRNCYDRKPMETNLLGLKVDKKKPGIYYLATTNGFPYFMGKDGLKKENEYVFKQLKKLNADDEFVF